MVVLKRMLPHSEKAVFVVMTALLRWLCTGGDHLVEKVRGLLVEREIPKLVADEQRGLGIASEFAHQGVIDLGGQQVIEHVHGGREEGSDIGLAGPPAEDLGQIGLAGPRIPDQDHVAAFLEEVEIEQPEDAALALHP